MMRRRLIGSAIVVALLAGLGFLFRSSAGDQPLPCQQHLQKKFLQDQKWVEKRVSDTLLPGYFSSAKGLRYLNETQEAVEKLDEWDRPGVSLFLYEGDSLLIWTGAGTILSDMPPFRGSTWDGAYLWQRYTLDNNLTWISRISVVPSAQCPADTLTLTEKASGTFGLQFPPYQIDGKPLPPLAFLSFGLALLVALCWLYSFVTWRGKRGFVLTGGLTWLLGLFLLTYSGNVLIGQSNTDHWLLQRVWSTSLLGPSVLAWLWQSLLLLLTMTIYFRFVRLATTPKNAYWSVGLAGVQLLSIGGFFLTNLRTFQVLVLTSSEWLQFDNIFRLNNYTIATLVGIGTWWLAFFLFAIRNTRITRSLVPSQNRRVILMIITSLLLLPLAMLFGMQLPNLVIVALLFTILPMLDFYFERDPTNLTWLFIWLILFGMLSAGTLYLFNLERDRTTMLAYAKKLAPAEDPVLQKRLGTYREKALPGSRYVQQVYSDPYVQKYYQPDLSERPTFPVPDSASTSVWEQKEQEHDRLWIFEPFDTLSIFRPLQPITYYRPYQDLLDIPPYRRLTFLDRYDFLVIRDQKVVDQQGMPSRSLLSQINQLDPGESLSTLGNQRLTLVYRYNEQRSVLLERSLGIYLIKPLSLFAFLFLVMLSLCILFALGMPLLGMTQGSVVNLFGSAKSLRTKIQLSVLALIICSFSVIAMLTIFSFRRSSTNEQETRLLQRVASMRNGLQSAIKSDPGVLASSETLDSLARELLQQYRLDLNLYNRKGRRIAGSGTQLPDDQNRQAMMAPEAFESLRSGLEEYRLVLEQWGPITFKTVYVPLQERSTLYLGVPYYAQNQEMQDDLYDFMGTLFSVYAFTLLIAAAVTLYVSRLITMPLDRIREGLGNLRLGSNEPLTYEGKDEIGDLVREYNEAIHKLEESTELLRKSERESAWREMAKQVAHEIKNPLTPMKLRIQHLMRAYQQDPERAAPMIKKVSNSLIEQIDTLTRIANEFSRFAKMPKPQNVDFDLQRLLESVTTIFAEEDAGHVLFTSDLPAAPVHADRDHLTRVFNNLIKNGLQAIPDERKGLIQVTLTQREHYFLVTVTDNGKGIPEDIQHKVFSPNFTTKSSGTGLGLAMSRQMIEQAGGRIYFETELGVGTTFYVELPCQV
jgi:signal transduction histidine kinase